MSTGAAPLMLPEPVRRSSDKFSIINTTEGEIQVEEDVGSAMVHEKSYLPSRSILQRSEFLLPLDSETFLLYRGMVQK